MSTGEKVVYGKDLHKKLEVKTDFSTWVKRRFNECDATENEDYEVFLISGENSNGGRPQIDYIIKLDIAKEMDFSFFLLSAISLSLNAERYDITIILLSSDITENYFLFYLSIIFHHLPE